jgi:hypothetical protein
MDKEDRRRSSDNRVWWSDFGGFPSVRVDARHDHTARRKGKAMKWIIAAMTGILIIELYWIFSPHLK